MSPIFVNKEFHLCIGFKSAKPPLSNIKKVNADVFTTQIEEIQKILQDNMLIAQVDHEWHANQHRGLVSQYKIDDLVWLDTKNLFTKRPSRKLKNRYVGKYRVKMIISNHTVELALPNDLYVHFIFHFNLFEPAASDDPHPGHVQPLSPPIKVDGETKYEITAIVILDSSKKPKNSNTTFNGQATQNSTRKTTQILLMQ